MSTTHSFMLVIYMCLVSVCDINWVCLGTRCGLASDHLAALNGSIAPSRAHSPHALTFALRLGIGHAMDGWWGLRIM